MQEGYTGLCLAAHYGHLPIVVTLLAYDLLKFAMFKVVDCEAENSFRYASSTMSCVRSAKADVHRPNNVRENFIILFHSARVVYAFCWTHNSARCVQYGNTPLHRAAIRGFCEIVDLLIDAGADLNARNKVKRSPKNTTVRHLVGIVRDGVVVGFSLEGRHT